MTSSPEKVTFTGAQGEPLSGTLDLPDGAPRAYALFAHCFTCSKDFLVAKRLSRALLYEGIAVFRFDFTGLGESDGDFANTNFSSNVGDLIAAANYLKKHRASPEILIGHSLGGSAVIAAAGHLADTKAVATINAPADPEVVRDLIRESVLEIEQKGEAEVQIGDSTFRIRSQFLEDIATHKLQDAVAKMDTSLLVLHAPDDEIVPIDNASQIFTAAKHPKSFVALEGADHLLTREADALYAGRVLSAWASRYISEPQKAVSTEGSGPRFVFVTETGEGKYANVVQVGGHTLTADEPASVGGDDTGPNPYEYLLAGLGACTTMTLRMYADRKGWPLEKVRVRLRHEKIHADDCENCETQEGKIDQIEREIELSGPLDDAQRARIMEIADKCPVHRTLHSEVEIVTLEGIA